MVNGEINIAIYLLNLEYRRDGISNPFIKGLHHECQLVPGQRKVEPGK